MLEQKFGTVYGRGASSLVSRKWLSHRVKRTISGRSKPSYCTLTLFLSSRKVLYLKVLHCSSSRYTRADGEKHWTVTVVSLLYFC